MSYLKALLATSVIGLILLGSTSKALAHGEINQSEMTIKLHFTGIKSTDGQLHYQVFSCSPNETTEWEQLTADMTNRVKSIADTTALTIRLTPGADYCIRAFQDTNNNGALDFGTSGIPREPVGFSTNPSLMLGYPLPAATLFKLVNDQITIKMNYPRHLRRKKRGVN